MRYLDALPDRYYQGDEEATVAGAGLSTIATIGVDKKELLCFHFEPATQAVDQLEVYGRAHPDAQLQTLTPTAWTALPSGGRFRATAVHTTSTGAYVDGDLDSVATTENGYFELDVEGLCEVVVKASAAADSSVVTSRWSLQ